MRLLEIQELDTDREKNVTVLFNIIEAAKKDHAESRLTDKKFSLRDYTRRLNDAYPNMDNKTALQTAVRTTRIREGLAKGNESTISGNDLYRVSRFFLRNLSSYGWENIKNYLSGLEEPYKSLLNVEASESSVSGITIKEMANRRVGSLVKPGEKLSDGLREAADVVDALEKQLRLVNTEKDHVSRENAVLREKLSVALSGMNKIMEAYETAAPEKKEELKTKMQNVQLLLKSLQNIF